MESKTVSDSMERVLEQHKLFVIETSSKILNRCRLAGIQRFDLSMMSQINLFYRVKATRGLLDLLFCLG